MTHQRETPRALSILAAAAAAAWLLAVLLGH